MLVMQDLYDSLDKSSPLPLSLYDDLVRITKLARIGQDDLYNAIRSCCASNSSNASGSSGLSTFVSSVNHLASAAPVSLSEIKLALNLQGDDGKDAKLDYENGAIGMVGTLLNSGGISNCKAS